MSSKCRVVTSPGEFLGKKHIGDCGAPQRKEEVEGQALHPRRVCSNVEDNRRTQAEKEQCGLKPSVNSF